MTKNLDTAIAAIKALPPERQDEIAAYLTEAAQPAYAYSPEQVAKLDESLAEADAGQFVSDDTVAKIFGRYRQI